MAAAARDDATHSTRTTDPLVEQMSSVLRMASPSRSTPTRERRFSDTDRPRPTSSATTTASDAVAVLSTDGTRWLPAPDQKQRPPKEPVSRPSVEPHQCQAAQCAISKVFATTELCTYILSYLDTKSILRIQRTSRHWHSTIQTSPHLRLHHFVHGRWNLPASNFQLLPLNSISGLDIQSGKKVKLGQWISVTLTSEAARRISPRARPQRRVRSRSVYEGLRGGLGTRAKAASARQAWECATSTHSDVEESSIVPLEDLLITQPPMICMQAHILRPGVEPPDSAPDPSDEEEFADSGLRACAKVSCEGGITLGALAVIAQTLFAELESEVDVKVVFKAIVSFTAPEESGRRRSHLPILTRIDGMY